MAKITTVALDEIYPLVDAAFPNRLKKYKDNIENFIKVRAEDLYDTVPVKRIPFTAEDVKLFFTAMDIDRADITKALSHTYYWNINFNPRAAKDEFTMVMMMVLRYFCIKKDEKNADISAVYLAFSGKFYPSIHSQKFKIPPEQYRYILEYVLNNVFTQKYDLKREGSVFGAVRSICRTWLSTYRDKLVKDPDDSDIAGMIQQLHGRIKSFLGNIAAAYYEAYENKDYITFSSDSNDQDSYRVSDSDSLLAERVVEKSMNWITSKNVDFELCRMASDKNVHTDEIKSIIESIQSDKDNLVLIRELMRLMVIEFFANSKSRDVASYEFVAYSVVAKPNSKNKNVNRMKEIIENWLDENSSQYRKRKSRMATKSSYNRSIMTYYVLIVNKANR